MIYTEEIIVTGKVIPDALTPSDVWQELGGFLQHRGHLGDAYKLSLEMQKNGSSDLGITKLVQFQDIDRELKLNKGVPAIWASLPSKKGILPLQLLTFSTKRSALNLGGRLESFPNEWDSFFMTSRIGEKLINMLIHPSSYRKLLKQYKTPPENDLLQAPGLANDRGAYLEGVSAEMWFGESFWQYAACSKDDVLACDWIKCQDRGFQLHVEAWPEPFTSAEGEQGVVQRKLLDLLFGIGSDTENKQPPPMPKMS